MIFASKDPDSYTKLDKAADSDSGIPEPETGKPIGGPKMDLLRVVPPWVKWPDYERVKNSPLALRLHDFSNFLKINLLLQPHVHPLTGS